MTHRGPTTGHVPAPGVAFGVRRLSIVDVEGGPPTVFERGRQRLGDPERRALQPPRASATSSTATGTASEPLRHGDPAAPLRGTRAALRRSSCAACSASPSGTARRRAVLARDRLGVKPLYYARAAISLVFASELKSLLASGLVTAELDYEAIDAYLTLGFFPAPRRRSRRVEAPAGSSAGGRRRRRSVERYWSYPAADASSPGRGPRSAPSGCSSSSTNLFGFG